MRTIRHWRLEPYQLRFAPKRDHTNDLKQRRAGPAVLRTWTAFKRSSRCRALRIVCDWTATQCSARIMERIYPRVGHFVTFFFNIFVELNCGGTPVFLTVTQREMDIVSGNTPLQGASYKLRRRFTRKRREGLDYWKCSFCRHDHQKVREDIL
jgi:hypothetical protein